MLQLMQKKSLIYTTLFIVTNRVFTMANILVTFHTSVNAGYAMSVLERVFFDVCQDICGSQGSVFFSFNGPLTSAPKSLPEGFTHYTQIDYSDNGTFESAGKFIEQNNIQYALCFDVQPHSPICKMLRTHGVKKIVSYWGASMSSKKSMLVLLLKKLDVWLQKYKPDHFIFESAAMQFLAVNGRGIPLKHTSIIHTGIDPNKYTPTYADKHYLLKEFSIPENAKIVFYSGHMEKRKGVDVIIESAIELVDREHIPDLYFLICGNRPGEEIPFQERLKDFSAFNKVIFGGYRKDLHLIMPNCTIGVVASTGWDSFPMSTLEMAASGLPIVVSRLQGLVETVSDGETGYLFEPGNSQELSEKIKFLINNTEECDRFSKNARERILKGYTLDHQKRNLISCLQSGWDLAH